jgi:hypothetical protein
MSDVVDYVLETGWGGFRELGGKGIVVEKSAMIL